MSFSVILLAVILCIVAGFLNGSFATPTKWMERWREENIWLGYTVFCYLLLPVLSLMVMDSSIFSQISSVPSHFIWVLVLGGLAWGIGQVFFALAFKHIGLGVNFVINISMGTAGGALLPMLWTKGAIGSTYSYIQLLGVVIFVMAVILTTAAGAARNKTSSGDDSSKGHASVYLILGVLFAILAGVGSIAQGNSFAFSNPIISKTALENGASLMPANTVAFALVFFGAFIPNFIFFMVKNIKSSSLHCFAAPKTGKYWFYLFLMALGSWGSIVVFCKAQAVIGGDLAPTIAWPLFMAFIILTANFWSFMTGEWKGAGRKAISLMSVSIVLLVSAVVVFGANSMNKPATGQQVVKVQTLKDSKPSA
ncbi:L-rhamnose/proton symporter RhaT [Dongshaea marina]|uniref:L-rhamnose/proton symporter RhaT n=1 Tax=Dongshaea marina TaxID=2047966 RepID=UPI000D3E4DF1|nr:L-rhamnose/proton symporter RhaT [Dongshaea marina]